MAPRKKLIEVALPLEAINEASAYEKMPGIGLHPRGIHMWWARRPLVASRAVIFASLVDDPDDPDATPEFVEACRQLARGKNAIVNDTPRQRLFDFIEQLVRWENTTNEEVLKTAHKLIRLTTNGNPPPMLDPFAGGGSIPLEAQRLGLEAHASDLNPIAVMINKALIEIPPRFANRPPVNPRDRLGTAQGVGWIGLRGLASDVNYYGEWMLARAKERIGFLYPRGPNNQMVIAWIWARTVKCPNPACGTEMPLVQSFELSKRKKHKVWLEPYIDQTTRCISFKVKSGSGPIPEGTVSRRGASCLACNSPVPLEHIRSEGRAGRIGMQLLAVVTEGQRGRNYYAPRVEDELAAQVETSLDVPNTELPKQALGFRIQPYGMMRHSDLFTPRQLLVLKTFSDLVTEVKHQIHLDAIAADLSDDGVLLRDNGTGAQAYTEAVSVYLAFVVDRLVDFNNSMTRWVPSNEKIMSLLGRQAIPMIWDFGEANALADVVGGWPTCLDYVAECITTLSSENQGYTYQADAAVPFEMRGGSFIVSTDPPYYDNIGYADLSDILYIWARRSLREVYPNIFGTLLVPKTPELIANPGLFEGNAEAANQHFEQGLERAFINIRHLVSPDYPLTVYYAFKQSEVVIDENSTGSKTFSSTGWETMLESLIRAGFTINGTWPMRTESSSRIRNIDSNALASSIVLVCRPRLDDAPTISRREFVNALRREMPAALHELQSGNIAPVDMAQASIGPGMAVYSRYRKVLEANGEALTVRTALQLINQELDTYLAEQEGDVDADTRFAINWFEQYGYREGEFGVADVLARAKNTSVEGVANAGVVIAGGGKVRLLPWQELEAGWDPSKDRRATVWEGTHHLIERLNTHGEDGAARLLVKMSSDLAAEARALAYRLYSVCERKGWADIARDYNALVVSWPRLQELANELRQNQPPEQLGLL